MATAVASRFAVLSLDDDDDTPKKSQPKKKTDPKKANSAGSNQAGATKKKNAKKNESGKANQGNQGNQGNQNTNASAKSKGKSGKSETNKEGSQKKKGNPVVTQEQWDQWKKKDSEFVDTIYEQDMQQAILLSKTDYEKKKDHIDQVVKITEPEKKQQGSGSKKSKKANKAPTMTLDEFNNRGETPVNNGVAGAGGDSSTQADTQFFERIKDDVKKVLSKEHEDEKKKVREPYNQERVTVAQLEDRLEKRNKENKVLKEEIAKLKEDLLDVRLRNTKLCNILGQGEMKDKAQVLMEVERLQQMRDELSEEVQSLHAQLEQERSKVRSLTAEQTKGKSQNKKQRSTSETNNHQ